MNTILITDMITLYFFYFAGGILLGAFFLQLILIFKTYSFYTITCITMFLIPFFALYYGV